MRHEHKHHHVYIKPGEKDCRILVNGDTISAETQIHHNDRLVFGSTQVWVFQNPKEHGIDKKKYPPITFEYSQEEIAAKAGIKVDGGSGSSSDMALLQEDLIDVMPAVEEANSISEELDKRVKFEIILISPHMLGKMQSGAGKPKVEGFDNLKSTQPEVCVKMKNLENGTEFIWPKEKFLNRLYLMKEMYNNYEEEEEDWDLPEDKDPFQEDVNTEVNIGSVQVFLQPVAYMVEMKEQLEITDLNRLYLERDELRVEILGRGTTWLDTGTPDSLADATAFVQVIQQRQGLKIACPEEIAFLQGRIDRAKLSESAARYSGTPYGDYLKTL